MSNCLLIEDSAGHRKMMLPRFQEINHLNIIAPADQIECELIIKPSELVVAVIDFKLKDWIGDGKRETIVFNQQPILDGVDLAEQLYKSNPAIVFCLYSSSLTDLEKKLKHSWIKTFIHTTFEFGDDQNDVYAPIEEFLLKVSETQTAILQDMPPMPKLDLIRIMKRTAWVMGLPESMTEDQQLFYYRQILSLANRGTDRWKSGEMLWRVAIDEVLPQNQLEGPTEKKIPSDHFEIWIDSKNYIISGIRDANSKFGISSSSYDEAILQIERAPRYELLFELFIVKSICARFVAGEIIESDTIRVLKRLSTIAQDESQKYLYRKLILNSGGKIGRQEIDAIMAPFQRAGMMKVIDIYDGHVAEIADGHAIATLTNILDPVDTFPKALNPEHLNDFFLVEDSVFEYVLYKGPGPKKGYQLLLLN